MRAVALLLGALAFCAAGSAAAGSWKTYRHDGVSLRYPPSWHATANALTPVTQPSQLLAVASYPLPRDASGADGCSPKEALDRLPTRGVFIYGWEYGDVGVPGLRTRDFPPRPKRFSLGGFARYECLGPSYRLNFRDRDRLFQIHLAFGPDASAATRRTALSVLDSIRVARR